MDNVKTKNLISIILRGIGLAMGMATFVLGILDSIEVKSAVNLLSLGIISYGLYLFQDKK